MTTPLPVISNVYRCTLDWNPAHGVTPRNVFHVLSEASSTATLVGAAVALAMAMYVFQLVPRRPTPAPLPPDYVAR